MNKGVDPIYPVHHTWVLQKVLLNIEFPEYVKVLLKANDLQRMLTGNVNGAIVEPLGQEASANLVHRIYQGPINDLQDKWEPQQNSAEEFVLKDSGVGSVDGRLETQSVKSTRSPFVSRTCKRWKRQTGFELSFIIAAVLIGSSRSDKVPVKPSPKNNDQSTQRWFTKTQITHPDKTSRGE
jgi:hypothetical protein